MWEGPSWLAAEKSATHPVSDGSPPMKWPRVVTPPSRRQSLLSEADDSGVGVSFSSPPVINKSASRPSPLRTPSSRAVVHMSSTPSPFRSFRLSCPSPSFTNRALRLSNTENVIGFKFCENSMEKSHGQVDLARLASSNVARCLDLPPPAVMSSNCEEDMLDRTLPMHCDAPETPSKCFLDESGIFEDGYPLFSTSTPLKRLSFEQPRVPCPGTDASSLLPLPSDPDHSLGGTEKTSPPTPSSFKKAMQDVQRQGSLQPRQILMDDTDDYSNSSTLRSHSNSNPAFNEPSLLGPQSKRKRELESDELFRSPKKPLKPYSRRWMRLVAGGSRAQRDMTMAAKTFLNQRAVLATRMAPALPPPVAPPTTITGFW